MAVDFFTIEQRHTGKGKIEIYPEFTVLRNKNSDLMIRGGDFYAVWNEEEGLWCTDENEVIRMIDNSMMDIYNSMPKDVQKDTVVRKMSKSSSGSIDRWHRYVQRQLRDNYHPLDEKIAFENTDVKKKDYISKRLPYAMMDGECPAYDELISTLYDEEERAKIEWSIGAIISGDSKKIQKFFVFYGSPGTGKSTIMNIIQKMFDGYWETFEAKELVSSNNSFSLESFKSNPLIVIQHDGDLSRIEDNTKLNSIVSHETMEVNEKYAKKYKMRFNAFIFIGTNRRVSIQEAKSGLIRRLIDINPTGKKIPIKQYNSLMKQIDFELGAIANHCLNRYLEMGPDYYNDYVPRDMIRATNDFEDYISEDFDFFIKNDPITASVAYMRYSKYCDLHGVNFKYKSTKFKDELRNYYEKFVEEARINGTHVRSVYYGFKKDIFTSNETKQKDVEDIWLKMESSTSEFDHVCKGYKAQYANQDGKPKKKWDNVATTLGDLSTQKLHYVQLPEEHIVIDFDIKNEKGEKDKNLNIEAASKWPPTYAEFSKSGSGVHLHYLYSGDVSKLMNIYDTDIEIKKFTGNASLRRQLSTCCNLPIATLSSGLPLKKGGDRKVLSESIVKDEKHLRNMIKKNLRKEIHANTKPSVDFIFKILEDAYNSGMAYDVSDMRPSILAFALNSSNQREACLDIVAKMNWKSEEPSENIEKEAPIVFFDIEVFPNLFLVNYKKAGKRTQIVRMINPEPEDIRNLVQYRLIGFNNRRYDNHILYARLLGYSIEDLYTLSQRIIKGNGPTGMFGEAYNLSYADIYDYSAKKQSLKKWEIELGIHHQELGLPWDQPVPEEMWVKVAEYCDNDVKATEAVFNHLKEDFVARQVLAELSGLTVNDTTRMHATRIIFQGDRHPDLLYTDLSEMFPGYSFDHGKSTYRGEDPSEGGYVYSEPGIYGNVALLDVSSMHPTSMIELNIFGSYTQRFKELVEGRLAVKRKDKRAVKGLLNGVLEKYMGSDEEMDALAYALKIVINSVYGFTAASFDNPFRDPRNKDNIVAKRGALFMIDLKHAVQEKGFTVAHIKTDSIKIPDATPEIIEFVCEFGKKYGYSFEHEATYDKFLLVNDAVYVAKDKKDGHWTATGAEFQHPYIFKKLFTNEPIEFKDMCETKTVTTAIYINMNETLPEGEDNFVFVGRAGSFVPVKPGRGGGELFRQNGDKWTAVGGTKGYRWMEAEVFKNTRSDEDIDYGYFERLVDNAKAHIMEYTDFSWFVSNVSYQEALPFHDKANPPKKGD